MATYTMSLPEDLIAEVDGLVGPEGRDHFVQEVVDADLRRRRLLAFIAKNTIVMKDEDHPEFAEGSAAWVSKLRAGNSD